MPVFFSLRNKKTGKTLKLSGATEDVAFGHGNLVLAEALEAVHTSEQHWSLTPEGLLRSRESNKCLGVVGSLGSGNSPDIGLGVRTHTGECQYGVVSTDQAWNLTAQGLLVNQYTGLCLGVNMALVKCPLSDQVWHIRNDGFVVNQVSGLCLDVEGDPGMSSGDKIALWPCEYGNEDTDQKWEFTEYGFLRNRKNGKCLDVKHIHGVFLAPRLVIWDCVQTLEGPVMQRWQLGEKGFIQNLFVGKCIDVPYARQGAPVRLETCEKYHLVQTPNLWEMMDNGQIVNRGFPARFRGKCLTEKADGMPELTTCKTRTNQKWQISSGGRIEPALGMGKCIGDVNGSLGVHSCTRGKDAVTQKWQLTRDGFLMNLLTHKCVDVASDGRSIREAFCHMSDQLWEKVGDHVQSKLSGKCIDVRGGPPDNTKNGAELILWSCENTSQKNLTDQAWHFEGNGQIVNKASGECLDIQGGYQEKYTDAAKLILNACDQGSLSQRWYFTVGGFFKSYLNRKCVDVLGPAGHTNGQVLILYTCETGGKYTDQTWELIGENDAVVAAEQALKMGEDAEPIFKPPTPEQQQAALAEVQAEGAGSKALAKSAGQFVTYGTEVYWVYRGYKHLVPPSQDCEVCHCRHGLTIMAPTALEALPAGEDYECRLQDLADVVEGYKAEGDAGVTSAAVAEGLPAEAPMGRFVSSGQQVFWEYKGRRHKVPPGIGCGNCGCQDKVVAVTPQEIARLGKGTPFKCVLQELARYGANLAE